MKNEKAVPFLDLNWQYGEIKSEVTGKIGEILEKSAFIGGEPVSNFEKNFSRFCGTAHGIGVASGTDALILTLEALGVGAGDEVITVSNTFIATVAAIKRVGAAVRFIDIDRETYQMNIDLLEEAINEKTKVIIPVHLYGHPVDMSPLLKIAKKFNVKVVEDACQAHGALYQGKKVGSFGDAACFSFYPGKNLGAFGDAGIVVTDNKELDHKIRLLRDHGRSEHHSHLLFGANSRLDAIQAAVLDTKLVHLEEWNEKRGGVAAKYRESLSGIPAVKLPLEKEWAKAVYHLYVVEVPSREKVVHFLRSREIGVGIHYPIPVHKQEAFKDWGLKAESLKETEDCSQNIISLPIYPGMREEQVERVCDQLKVALKSEE